LAQGGLISRGLFSLYVTDMPSPSHHVEFSLYADGTAIIATSREPTLLVRYLESYLNDLQRWLSECRIDINVSNSSAIIFARDERSFIQPRPVTTWSPHNDQVRKKTAQMMGMLGTLLNRKSDLSVWNRVLLFKQIIRPMMNYTCPTWRSAARTYDWRLQLLQSKCLRLSNAAP